MAVVGVGAIWYQGAKEYKQVEAEAARNEFMMECMSQSTLPDATLARADCKRKMAAGIELMKQIREAEK